MKTSTMSGIIYFIVWVFVHPVYAQIEFERVPISADYADVHGLHVAQSNMYIEYGNGYSVSNDGGETWYDHQLDSCSVRQMMFGSTGIRYAVLNSRGVILIVGLNETSKIKDTLLVLSILSCWMFLDDGDLIVAGNEGYNEPTSSLFRIGGDTVETYRLPRLFPHFITKDLADRWFLGYSTGDTLLYHTTDGGRSWQGHTVPDPIFTRLHGRGDNRGMFYTQLDGSIVRWNLNTGETKTISHLQNSDITHVEFDENRNPCMITRAGKTGEYRFDPSSDSLVFIEWDDQIIGLYDAMPIREGEWFVDGRNNVYIVKDGRIVKKIVPKITKFIDGALFEDSSSDVYLVTRQKIKKLDRGETSAITEYTYRDELEAQHGDYYISGNGDLIILGQQSYEQYYSNHKYMMSKKLPLPCSLTCETAHSLSNVFIATTTQCGRQHAIRYSTDAAASWKWYPIDDIHTVWGMACSETAGVIVLSIENRSSLDEFDGPERRQMRLSRIVDSSRIEINPPEALANYSAVRATSRGDIILIGDSRVAITEDFGEHWHIALDDDNIDLFWGTAAIDEQGNIAVFNTRNDCLFLYRKAHDTWTVVPINFIKEYPGSILLTSSGYVFLYSQANGLFRSKTAIW